MKIKNVNKLEPGLYEIFWKKRFGGGFSIAVIGDDEENKESGKWFHCSEFGPEDIFKGVFWRNVKSVYAVYLKSIYSDDIGDKK